jgi:hypothetical protein
MVEKPAVYSQLFWLRKYGKSDSDTPVLIVISFRALFAFKTFAVVFLSVNLLEFTVALWLIASLSRPRPGVDPKPGYVGFIVDFSLPLTVTFHQH